MIVTDKPWDYLNDFSIATELEVDAVEKTGVSENSKRAYALFINKEYDKARELLEIKDSLLFLAKKLNIKMEFAQLLKECGTKNFFIFLLMKLCRH